MPDSSLAVPRIAAPAQPAARIDGVDLLRGLVMVLMVLDHTRDFFTNANIDPTDLATTTPALFFTRWITHFCAPTFALLAGVGVRLASLRGMPPRSLAWFLFTRGVWLIFLEQTVERFGLLFRIVPYRLIGLVLWSIGGSFLLLAPLIVLRVPARVVGVLGLVILFGHNLLDGVASQGAGVLAPLVTALLKPGFIDGPGEWRTFIMYPLLPWFGVVATGYWLGGVYSLEPGRRRALLVTLGTAAVFGFLVLRGINIYGDPQHWSPQANTVTTILSFLNTTKYPPSLCFLLMTLGPALLSLAAFDRGIGPIGRPLLTFGRVPLFYYLLQWYVIHTLALLGAMAQGAPIAWLFIESFPAEPPPSCTYGLPAVHAWWLAALLVLYFPCAWFADFKRRHRDWWWLGYL